MGQDSSEPENRVGIPSPWDPAVAPAELMLCVHAPESSSKSCNHTAIWISLCQHSLEICQSTG